MTIQTIRIAYYRGPLDKLTLVTETEDINQALPLLMSEEIDGVLLDKQSAHTLFSNYLEQKKEYEKIFSSEEDKLQPRRTHVSSKTHHGIQRVPINEIYFFQADQKYVTVHHTHGTLLIEDTLKDLEKEFPQQFLRIHRNVLVNIDEIESIEKDSLKENWLKLRHHEARFKVSRRKLPSVRKRMQKN